MRATIALMRGNLYAGPNDNNMCSINSENLAFHEDKRDNRVEAIGLQSFLTLWKRASHRAGSENATDPGD